VLANGPEPLLDAFGIAPLPELVGSELSTLNGSIPAGENPIRIIDEKPSKFKKRYLFFAAFGVESEYTQVESAALVTEPSSNGVFLLCSA